MKKVMFFILFTLTLMLVIPVYNFASSGKEVGDFVKEKNYYSLDNLLPEVSHFFYKYGISLFPRQAVVGYDGWLFLGDDYAGTITAKRKGASSEDVNAAQNTVDAMTEWRSYFLENGVNDFKILIGPDKASVYPELSPIWANPHSYSKVDAILSVDNENIFVALKDYLIESKEGFDEPLYYSTDTHWNALGAGLSTEYFISELSRQNDLIFNMDRGEVVSSVRAGGDLSRFLRISEYLRDKELSDVFRSNKEINVKRFDFNTGELLGEGGNPPLGAPNEAIRVVSDNAVNQAKILWLRDSFGTAMSPYMAALFSETIQLHYGHASTEWLANVVKQYQPDYVFVTVVERALPGGFFMSRPPLQAVPLESLENKVRGEVAALNHIALEDGVYRILDNDPFIIYSFEEPLDTDSYSHIFINATCSGNGSEDVNVQVFWDTPEARGFSEDKSVKFSLPQGGAVFDLSRSSSWGVEGLVNRIRVDIDPASIEKCSSFTQQNIEVGGYRRPLIE